MRTVFALAFAMFSTTALATDFTTVLRDMNGAPIMNCPPPVAPAKDAQGKPVPPVPCATELTLSALAVGVLTNDRASPPTPEEKVSRFELAMKVNGKKDITLTTDDVLLLKKLIGKSAPTIIYGRVLQIIAPSDLKR